MTGLAAAALGLGGGLLAVGLLLEVAIRRLRRLPVVEQTSPIVVLTASWFEPEP